MPHLTEPQWRALAETLERETARVIAPTQPDWTVHGASDPGTTLVEVFAFLVENLLYRTDRVPGRNAAALRLARAAAALAGSAASASTDGLSRVNYLQGMVLGVDDFRTEQEYFRARLARLNLALHGCGIVSGLDVTLDTTAGSPQGICVAPGMALDPRGQEIVVVQPACAALPVGGATALVQLRYVDRLTAPVPIAMEPGADGVADSRIVESFAVFVAPEPAADAVVLARLVFRRGHWRVDKRYGRVLVRGAPVPGR